MSHHIPQLVAVLLEARELLAQPENDFAWSKWHNAAEALGQIECLIAAFRAGQVPDRSDVSILFAPTGSIQEVSISSGWGDEFLSLASRFDVAMAAVYGSF